MYSYELLAIVVYLSMVFAVGYLSYRKSVSAADFIIGGRSLNYWLTALAAHASDMSSWLFMGYPAAIFTAGLFGIWTAIGLLLCMFLNWQLIAPKIRVATEEFKSLTFSSFFESRLQDTSGRIRLFSALILIVFYTIYISAGLTGMGDLLTTLFDISYGWAVLIGILIVIPYVFSGGYTTLAWIDLFQGCFLLCVIIGVPLYLLTSVGGVEEIKSSFDLYQRSTSLFPDRSTATWFSIFSMTIGWGLGYFGQPHIVTKFMGINQVSDISKSKWIGMSWMFLSLSAATLVGAVGVSLFQGHLKDPEQVFIEMVQGFFPPFLIGIILCAVLAATINAISSQVLVLTSSLSADIYKRILRPRASSKELLFVSRMGVILSGALAFVIAFQKTNTIYSLVQYAWSGIGASFGPLVLLSLYSKHVNKYGAWAGILGGGVVAAIWPYCNRWFSYPIAPLIPGFAIGFILIMAISYATKEQKKAKR